MTINFNNDQAFILKRTFYKERYYLLDLFHCEVGRFRGSARINHGTNYRFTDKWVLFQEILINGYRKSDLANIRDSELYCHFPLSQKQQLAAHYLNELLLNYLPADDPAPELYHSYRITLSRPSRQSYRYMEYQLLKHIGLIPEIKGISEHYLLSFEHSIPVLNASAYGFDHNLIQYLQDNKIEELSKHPQTKSLFQQILHHQKPFNHNTRNISRELLQLSQKCK